MEDRIPYIEIAPCKEEEPTRDTIKLRGKFMSDIGYNIQRQEREWENPWDSFPVVDKIVYRSLAIRAGVSF